LGLVDMGVLGASVAAPWVVNEFTKPVYTIEHEETGQDAQETITEKDDD